MPSARHALRSDSDRLTRTLVSAFTEDPVTSWMFDDPQKRPVQLAAWMSFALEMGLTRGHTYWSGDREAVAIWSPPDVSLFDELWGPRLAQMMAEQIGERSGYVMKELTRVMGDAGMPDEPHFYLFMLGTEAEAQGRGRGAEVIAPVLELCDELGVAAHLESSNARNLSFYQRHGFEVSAEVQLGEDGPIVRPMRRPPR